MRIREIIFSRLISTLRYIRDARRQPDFYSVGWRFPSNGKYSKFVDVLYYGDEQGNGSHLVIF